MSWRTVIITKTAKLDLSLGNLVIRDIENTTKIHIGEISILIIESNSVSITAALLCELVKGKVKVIFCDEKRNPLSELTPYYGSHDCSIKIKRQIEWQTFTKQCIWTNIVCEKINNQAAVLEYYKSEKAVLLRQYVEEIEFFDKSNREGHAAKVYFNALFGKKFSRNSDSAINAALNYGYSIILSNINREVVLNGYITQLGLFHDNMFNQYNFSCDLMEPFRPYVDFLVKEMEPVKFEKDEKAKILTLLNKELLIDDRTQIFTNAVKIYCKSVFSALEEKDTTLIRFPKNEL